MDGGGRMVAAALSASPSVAPPPLGLTVFCNAHGVTHERAHAEADFAQSVFMAAASSCTG